MNLKHLKHLKQANPRDSPGPVLSYVLSTGGSSRSLPRGHGSWIRDSAPVTGLSNGGTNPF